MKEQNHEDEIASIGASGSSGPRNSCGNEEFLDGWTLLRVESEARGATLYLRRNDSRNTRGPVVGLHAELGMNLRMQKKRNGEA